MLSPNKLIAPELELSRDDVTVYRWQLTYGEALIELHADGRVLVNGDAVNASDQSVGSHVSSRRKES